MDAQYLNPRIMNKAYIGRSMSCLVCAEEKIFEDGFTFHQQYKADDGVHLEADWFCSLKCLTVMASAGGNA